MNLNKDVITFLSFQNKIWTKSIHVALPKSITEDEQKLELMFPDDYKQLLTCSDGQDILSKPYIKDIQ